MDYPSTITNAGRMRAPPPLHGHTHHMMHHVTDPTAPMMYQRYNMPSMLHGMLAMRILVFHIIYAGWHKQNVFFHQHKHTYTSQDKIPTCTEKLMIHTTT